MLIFSLPCCGLWIGIYNGQAPVRIPALLFGHKVSQIFERPAGRTNLFGIDIVIKIENGADSLVALYDAIKKLLLLALKRLKQELLCFVAVPLAVGRSINRILTSDRFRPDSLSCWLCFGQVLECLRYSRKPEDCCWKWSIRSILPMLQRRDTGS